MSAFEAVVASGVLAPIDLHFALLMRRRAGRADADVIALISALLSYQRSRGHSCIALEDWARRPFPADSGPPLPPLPDLADWRQALLASGLTGTGGGQEPLVLDGAGRLYMARYWRAEQNLAANLRQRLENPPPPVDAGALATLFRRLFDEADPSGQALAAAAALAGRVTLVTGGPGTGKTTTVGRVLALLLAENPERRIALAAPTGKAAARLGEAVAEQAERLPISDPQRDLLPTTASTLHRLLGYQPRRDRFRHHARRPLTVGALVIDEVSMVDLLLMAATLEAVPPDARVILLGDKDQLTSVETGSVFGDLCTAADLGGSASSPPAARSPGFADFYQALSGHRLAVRAAGDSTNSLLRDAAVELTTSFRFRNHQGIGELATQLRLGDAARAVAVLEDPTRDDVSRLEPPELPGAALEPLLSSLDAYLAATSPAQALRRLARFRVLCARRRGPWGSETLNAVVERHLTTVGHPIGEGFYPARPIMITANDYQLRLFNGDLGICWDSEAPAREGRNAAPRLSAYFPGTGDELRQLPLAGLPPHETAWAMTVHKSQGSEFDHVLLVLGDTDSRVLTRELLYTGATRARRSVTVVTTIEVFRAAVARRSRRVSGLADALAGTPAEPPAPPPEPDPEPPPAADQGQLSLFG